MALQIQHLECDSEEFPHYFLCQYRPLSVGLDDLSRSLLNFKEGRPLDVEAWIACSISELEKVPILKNGLVLRVLSSTEKVIRDSVDTPLDLLGKQVSEKIHRAYKPDLLSKNRVTTKIKFLSLVEREAELSGVYDFDALDLAIPTSILIIDDILTTGTTVRAVIRAIRTVWHHCPIQIFTLASTDYKAKLNTSIQLSSYSYSWEFDKGWQVAEDEVAYKAALASLKSKIINDSFQKE